MGRHFWPLGHNGQINIAHQPVLARQQCPHLAQQMATVGTGEIRICIGKMPPDITQCSSTQQGVTQGVQHHVAVGVGHQPAVVGNTLSPQHHVIARAEGMDIKTVSDPHHGDDSSFAFR